MDIYFSKPGSCDRIPLSPPPPHNICYSQFKRTLLQTAILELKHFGVEKDLSSTLLFYKTENKAQDFMTCLRLPISLN